MWSKKGGGFHYGSMEDFQLVVIDIRYNLRKKFCNFDFCEYKLYEIGIIVEVILQY